MKRIRVVAALFCVTVFTIAPVQAAVVEVKFSGIVNYAFDYGLFGSLNYGDPFSVTYLFDNSIGSISPNEIVGGGSTGFPSPSLGAIVNINGQTFNIGGTYFGDLAVGINSAGGTGFGAIAMDNYGLFPNGSGIGSAQINMGLTNYTGALPTSLALPFTYFVQPCPNQGTQCDSAGGTLLVQDFRIQTNSGWLSQVQFIADEVTYSIDPFPTPLPAALPLFASCLGALGLLGWRRKRKAQAAA